MYTRVCHIFLDFKVSRYIEGYSFWSTYLRTLSLKIQKARTKIEAVLSLPWWLSQFSWYFDTKLLTHPNVLRLFRWVIDFSFLAYKTTRCLNNILQNYIPNHKTIQFKPKSFRNLPKLSCARSRSAVIKKKTIFIISIYVYLISI